MERAWSGALSKQISMSWSVAERRSNLDQIAWSTDSHKVPKTPHTQPKSSNISPRLDDLRKVLTMATIFGVFECVWHGFSAAPSWHRRLGATLSTPRSLGAPLHGSCRPWRDRDRRLLWTVSFIVGIRGGDALGVCFNTPWPSCSWRRQITWPTDSAWRSRRRRAHGDQAKA